VTTLAAPQPPTTTTRTSTRTVVSSHWLFAVLCYLYCDVLGFFVPADLAAILDGTVGGLELTDGFLLASAVLMTIPMGMVLLSRVAPHPVARWGTVGAGAVMTLVQVGSLFVGSGPRPHYVYFSVIEIATTSVLVVLSLRWRLED